MNIQHVKRMLTHLEAEAAQLRPRKRFEIENWELRKEISRLEEFLRTQ